MLRALITILLIFPTSRFSLPASRFPLPAPRSSLLVSRFSALMHAISQINCDFAIANRPWQVHFSDL
jgi:hypothetical protein